MGVLLRLVLVAVVGLGGLGRLRGRGRMGLRRRLRGKPLLLRVLDEVKTWIQDEGVSLCLLVMLLLIESVGADL